VSNLVKLLRESLFVCFLYFFVCFSVQSQSLSKAKELLDQEKTSEAIEIMQEILISTTDPGRQAEIQAAIGWAFVKSGNYASAEEHLQISLNKASSINKTDIAIRAINNLGIVYYLQNKLDESRAYFQQELVAESETAIKYLALINVKEKEILGEEALKLGVNKRYNKEFEDAIRQYDLSLTYLPKNPLTLDLKGYAQFRLGRYDEAIETLKLARDIDPNRPFIHLNLLKASCKLNDTDKVQQVIEESKLSKEQFRTWLQVDGELRRVCGKNTGFIKAIE